MLKLPNVFLLKTTWNEFLLGKSFLSRKEQNEMLPRNDNLSRFHKKHQRVNFNLRSR